MSPDLQAPNQRTGVPREALFPRLFRALGPYTNDQDTELMAQQVASNYRKNLERLVAVKNRYDPSNLFRLNANVAPTV